MIVPVKYVENSNNLGYIWYQKPKKKFFFKKTSSKFSKVYYSQNCIGYYTFCYYHC